ncbi:flagellar biosynthetic protein FliO [Microbulbifer thermotolerans]|uniref:Flagellar protein n=1 Tax=Microbulbifer thermotolerans TaxID=252514 RepID=A0AB35HXP0_MICTH|nr:flagellar biosynthetic protein FliO [Microbulbifer thermotolerans]MCX2780115.1 flagellar biosynthetic protein FliO [Microbulbifer thermotolerans]MCX2802141.1 flagellar biosynthetic protein FliO [Microbulbifer thermotolerans]MCX2805539.1 flagellar biosynthetic protein FliO [Microbulbifer thermotolerans]MCX2831934.1 flagellar biosynthetic protein FliO [Microbulbifer thermotolerans]MCX2842501.1 flagellar biosynthetic protein FliO [Microbulbifer thermotolerans]
MNPTSANAGEAVSGMALLGKTALVLAALIGLILLCGWLLRRLGTTGQGGANPTLNIVASRPVGPRERVVVVEIEDTWLVLGVGGGSVSKLHQLPAPPQPPRAPQESDEGFAERFARALGQNLSGRRSKS